MIGFAICRIENGSMSLKQRAARTPIGTATRIAPSVTSPLPTKIAPAPNSASSREGYHRVPVKNSPIPSIRKKGMASLMMK